MYLGSIVGISNDYYEAADGRSHEMAADQIHNAAVPEKHDDRIDHTAIGKIFYGLRFILPASP